MRGNQHYDSPEEATIHAVPPFGSQTTAPRSGQRDPVYGICERASTLAEWAKDRGYHPATRTYEMAS